MMVYRIYVEKKTGLANEAASLRSDIKTLLGIDRIEDVRVVNRYDVEDIDETLFEDCRWKVFAEPQLDNTADSLEELTGLFVDGNGYAKGPLAPWMRPTKFPEIPVSLERNTEVFRHPLL